MALIGPAELIAIRQYVQVGLDVSSLPDETISLPGFAGAGEADVRRIDPQVDTRTDPAQLQAARNAAALFAASYLVLAFPNLISERLPDYEYRLANTDVTKQSAALRDAAMQQLAAYIGVLSATPVFTFITTAHGYRGR